MSYVLSLPPERLERLIEQLARERTENVYRRQNPGCTDAAAMAWTSDHWREEEESALTALACIALSQEQRKGKG